jgi:ABC-type Fe3+-hydroxamate transport system substrate-binding protein
MRQKRLFQNMFFLMMSMFIAFLVGCRSEPESVPGVPKRIVSLAPSITKTLFALGLEDRIVKLRAK